MGGGFSLCPVLSSRGGVGQGHPCSAVVLEPTALARSCAPLSLFTFNLVSHQHHSHRLIIAARCLTFHVNLVLSCSPGLLLVFTYTRFVVDKRSEAIARSAPCVSASLSALPCSISLLLLFALLAVHIHLQPRLTSAALAQVVHGH